MSLQYRTSGPVVVHLSEELQLCILRGKKGRNSLLPIYSIPGHKLKLKIFIWSQQSCLVKFCVSENLVTLQ